MLNKDLASLYETETKSPNLAVKCNIKWFLNWFYVSAYKGGGGTRYLPCVFTEQGVAMLSGIMNYNEKFPLIRFMEINHETDFTEYKKVVSIVVDAAIFKSMETDGEEIKKININ